ncbi:formate/nitrite transporter family protein [Caballeronia sp. LZ035]|uniref:formate/nitrite transporter family protein n=1 Tax=Caballeronia sp. LZ035 TaxID=3038568 RepID=UPI00285A419A|nr:formate/nitrite transporter family protein [Caballeronia sp. LZ035]MDR5763211.1 formate/nitrite transporter family protein [Caballeronia sp. LZ035]
MLLVKWCFYLLSNGCAGNSTASRFNDRCMLAGTVTARAEGLSNLRSCRSSALARSGFSVPDTQAGSRSPHLNEGEQEQAADHATPPALVVHEIVREEGEAAIGRTHSALFWSSLAAGLSMGFSFLMQAVLESMLPENAWRAPISGFGYTIGFVIVILGRQQLFTESTLSVVLPVLTRRNLKTLRDALRVWAIVLAGNLVGTIVFAALLRVPGVFAPNVYKAFVTVAQAPYSGDFGVTMVRAIFAGWLIALMVWLLPSARSARLLTILLITYVVAACKLSHVIAGAVEAMYAVFDGRHDLRDFVLVFFIPTLTGNVIGGMSLVALINHAAIAPEIHGSDTPSNQH